MSCNLNKWHTRRGVILSPDLIGTKNLLFSNHMEQLQMLRGVYPERKLQTLRGVHPERKLQILRFAQNDKRRAQSDIQRRAQHDIAVLACVTYF